MKVAEITDKLIYHIRKAQERPVMQNLIYSNENPLRGRHEFLFFIKPEITVNDHRIRIADIFDMMFHKMQEYHFDIRDIRILGSSYLEKFDIIAQHYGVINAMSRKPLGFLTQEGAEKFKSAFGKPAEEANIAGSIEFLDRYKEYDPLSLNELWQKTKSVKLAGGTYCAPLIIGDEHVYLINGFHPRQLAHFTEPGRSIITMTLGGDIDWSAARNEFIGKTNPEDAKAGSLRNELLKQQNNFGLEEVNSSNNGFHLSAGPVEGLVELMRYSSDFSTGDLKTTSDFMFGRMLNKEFSSDEVRFICSNGIVVHNQSRMNVFDLTEEKNADRALILLKESKLIQ